MTPEELQAIRERCEAATPGEWKGTNVALFHQVGWVAHGPVALSREAAEADAAFIASARTDVPALIAEVERLREELETRADIASSTIARMKQQVREERAEVERLTREVQVERCGVRPIDELLQRVTTDRDELHVAWKREREEVERLTRERDEAREDLHDALRVIGEVSASAGIPVDAMLEDPTVITRRLR